MSELDKPNRKKAHTDTNLYLHHLSRLNDHSADSADADKENSPQRQHSITTVHDAFFKPQRPRHDDSFVEPRRNYGLPKISSTNRS